MILYILPLIITTTLAQGHGSPYWPATIITAPTEPAPTQTPLAPPSNALHSSLPPTEITHIPDSIGTQAPPPPPPPVAPVPSLTPPAYMKLCTESEWVDCEDFYVTLSVCENVPGRFKYQVSAIGPPERVVGKAVTCLFFDREDCYGVDEWMKYPGSGNMRGRRWDNRVVSWRCSADS